MNFFKTFEFTSIKQKIVVIFTVLIILSAVGTSLCFVFIYKTSFYERAERYIGDLNIQATNNLEYNIAGMENLSFEILSNSIIQNQLKIVNKKSLNEYELQVIRKTIESELEADALYNKNIVSLSVISNKGEEFTVQKVAGREIQKAFTQEEIYKANGSAKWGGVGTDHDINIARAILSLKTMKPLGYINIVCEKEYFNDIVNSSANSYMSGTYVVNENGRIMCTNNLSYLGENFPIDLEEIKSSEIAYYNTIDSENTFCYFGETMDNGWTIVTTVSVNEFDKEINQFKLLTFFICSITIIIAYCICVIFSQQISKPTWELLDNIKQFGKGNFRYRVRITTKDEIGQIGREYNNMADNIENLVNKVLRMEIEQKQAEIEFLKMQINPHFLYNTLDTISWMGSMGDNQDVSEMAIALGDLLRSTIKNDSFITVQEELKSVRNYLFIQKYRFGDKINVVYDIQDETLDYIMPNFLLQPLIENAIIHGLEPKIEPGKLLVQVITDEHKLIFSIQDNGIGMTEDEIQNLYKQCENMNEKQSIGMKNVYRRLQLYYGEACVFQIIGSKEEGMLVRFSIPQERNRK